MDVFSPVDSFIEKSPSFLRAEKMTGLSWVTTILPLSPPQPVSCGLLKIPSSLLAIAAKRGKSFSERVSMNILLAGTLSWMVIPESGPRLLSQSFFAGLFEIRFPLSFWLRYWSGERHPQHRVSPSPQNPSTRISALFPESGFEVNMVPESSESTIFWTITARENCPIPCIFLYTIGSGLKAESQQS